MPSTRRIRILFIGVLAIVVMTLVYTSRLRASEEVDTRTFNDFWQKTRQGLEKAHGGKKEQSGKNSEKEDDKQLAKDMQARLKAAEQKAKDSANAKVLRPEKPAEVIGVGSSAGGQKKLSGEKAEAKETDEEHQVETTLNEIYKKSPGETVWSHTVQTVR